MSGGEDTLPHWACSGLVPTNMQARFSDQNCYEELHLPCFQVSNISESQRRFNTQRGYINIFIK